MLLSGGRRLLLLDLPRKNQSGASGLSGAAWPRLPFGVAPRPWLCSCGAHCPGLGHPAAVVAWHLSVCRGCGRRPASLTCLVAPRGAPRLVRSGRSRCAGRLSRRRGAFPHPGGFRPRIYWAAAQGTWRPAENRAHCACRWLPPRQGRWARSASYPFEAPRWGCPWRVPPASVLGCVRCGGWRVWTRSLTCPVARTVRFSTGDSASAPGLFRVDADTSPCGSVDPRPGPVRVCVCSSCPGQVRRAGLPGAFWCASPFPLAGLFFCFARPPPGWCCPFLGPLLALPLFPPPSPPAPPLFFLLRAPPSVSCFLWIPAPGALGLGALFFFPPPSPACNFFFCAPVVSGFLLLPAPGALRLGAVCCLFCWPPASRLSVLSRLVCVFRLAVSSSLVVAAPPPPFVSRGFRRCLSVLVFFFVVRPRCRGLSLVPGLGCPGPWCCGFFLCGPSASLLSVRCRLFSVSRLAVGCSLVVAAPPPPSPFWRAVFVARCSVFCFFSRSFILSLSLPPLSLAFFGFRPRLPLALALCAFCFGGLPLLGCALLPLLCFPPGPWLLPGDSCTPPPLCVSRLLSRPPGPGGVFFHFFFFVRPRVSSFLWFPALGALGLGAVCCLFCWPPASWLAVRSRLFCVSRLAVGCSLVVAPPPPPLLCLAVFVAASRCSVFLFFRCAPPLSQAFSGLRPRVPWALALCVVCFPRGWLWHPVFCFVRRPLVWCCGLWRVLCCAWCCVACVSLVGFLRRVAVGLVVLFLLCFAVVRCCVLCWFFFRGPLRFRGAPCCSRFCALLVRCGACVPAVLLLVRCSVAPAALAGVLCCCLWCLRVCCWALQSFCCLLLGPGGSLCPVSVMCCGVSLDAVLRRVTACRAAWRCVVVCCVVSYCSAWCCSALCRVLGRCPWSCGPVSSALCFVLSRRAVCVLLWCDAACCCALLRVRHRVSCCAFPVLSALCGVAVIPCLLLVPCSPVLCPVVLCCRVVLWCPVLLPCLFGFSYLQNRCKIGFYLK